MNTKELQSELKRLAKFYDIFSGANQLADALVGMEQNEKELSAVVAARKADIAALEEAKQTLLAQNDATKAQAKKLVDDAKESAKKLVEAAQAKADDLVASAQATVGILKEEARQLEIGNAAAEQTLKDTDAKVAKAQALIDKQKAALANL